MKTGDSVETWDSVEIGDTVEAITNKIDPRYRQGRIVCLMERPTTSEAVVFLHRWRSAKDRHDCGIASAGRHLPPAIDPIRKRPLPRWYGPVIVRVDPKHKVSGKPLRPRFLHLGYDEVMVVDDLIFMDDEWLEATCPPPPALHPEVKAIVDAVLGKEDPC